MFNALTCRSATHSCLPIPSAPRLHLFSNKLFNFAVSASLIGQLLVIYLPFLQTVFQTEAIGFGDLVRLVCLASSVFWVDEARKWWARRNRGRDVVWESGYSKAV
jgi:P-type Ca2+ transporter type 2C